MERINLLGQVFGRLTVIEDTRPKCLCRCTCGNEKLIARNKLPNGRQKSCGCEHGNGIRAARRENALGVRAFRLTCVDNYLTGPNRLWRCDCGGSAIASPKDVRCGNTKSCGCWKNECSSKTGSITRIANGKGASQKRWRVIKGGKEIQLRSGFEYVYFNHLQANNIAFEYEPKMFVLEASVRYTPDFYLSETDEWIEVKGHLTERAMMKHELFRAAGHRLTILGEKEIKSLMPNGLWRFYKDYRRAAALVLAAAA